MAMLAFKAAYRAAGLEPVKGEGEEGMGRRAGGGELPDYLPLVLDFAALDRRGEKLLREHRADLELLLRALQRAESPYAAVIEAICTQLPALRRLDLARIRRAWDEGPPAEDVGLEPFAPPGYVTGREAAR